jgi:predicted enzyme related to lactoylglutathione lyase
MVYHAPDLAAAKQWYQEILEQLPYFDAPFYVGFNVGGYELGLIPDGEPARGQGTYWGVAHADSAFARLLAHGATVHEPIHDVGEGNLLGSVLDPFGNILGVIENPHFSLEP